MIVLAYCTKGSGFVYCNTKQNKLPREREQHPNMTGTFKLQPKDVIKQKGNDPHPRLANVYSGRREAN